MPTRFAALMLAALTSLACASPPSTVHADEATLENAGLAIAAWNEALSKGCPKIQLELAESGDAADIRVRMGDAPGELIGAERDGRITVDRQKAAEHPAMLPAVIAHEIGHVLVDDDGWHSSNPEDLMWAPVSSSRGPEPTAADVAAVCAAW